MSGHCFFAVSNIVSNELSSNLLCLKLAFYWLCNLFLIARDLKLIYIPFFVCPVQLRVLVRYGTY